MEILKYIAIAALTPIISAGVYLGSFFQDETPVVSTVGATIPTAIALYEDTLAGSISSSDTSFSLSRGTDKTGRNLASSTYSFIIDEGSANEEMVLANCTYRTCTGAIRGIDPLYGTSTTASLQKSHRRGASIKITDGPQLITISRILNGDETVPNVLEYGTAPTFTDNNQIVSKLYVDGVTTAGAPDAGTATKGIARLSVAAASSTLPIVVGDNDTRVPTQAENDALVGNNTDVAVGSGNKFVTQTGLQHNAEKYAADAGSNDTYVITLSPTPTSYTNGMVVHFKANTVNTGAATINVNGLGAKTIVKYINTTLADGDIAAGMFCTLIYDGTNFVLQNPVAVVPQAVLVYGNGVTTRSFATATGTVNIAHGLGKTPRNVKITAIGGNSGGTATMSQSYGSYNGTTVSSVFRGQNSNSQYYAGSSATKIITMYNWTNTATTPVTATISVDSTNISLTWDDPQGTGYFAIMWEAEA